MDSLNGTSTMNDTNETSHDTALENPLLNLTPEGFVHGLLAFIALAMLLGLPGNFLVVLVHWRIKTPTATDWVVFYIAVCDICSLIVCGPSFILSMTKLWNLFMPSIMCSFHFMIVHTCFIASTFLIAVSAVICRSVMINNREPMSARTSKLFGAFVIFCSIGLGSPAIVLHKNTPSGFCYNDKQKAQLQTIVFAVYLLITLISNAITSVCYLNIIPKICNATRVAPTDLDNVNDVFVRTRRAAIKVSICLALVSVVFLFSTVVPLVVATLLSASNHNVGVAVNTLIFVLSRLYFMNNFTNPLIYLFINRRFRHRVRMLFKRSRINTVNAINAHSGIF
ncbi:hypothetical protein DPMN_038825 [Dreissena polymorpha]|uniref:G-protein coupled receptors family 1 profile domain-containing protein n=1 Tax=Dreissena polymorpha TaxID=45954 RepID=A0A9D4MDH0_DREPO|nr:hypothetical protein DPMN_038825 [Dreissena polymorpha]